jgi:hypothetical protein
MLVTLMKEALSSSETSFLQEPNGVISQKTLFFIVTAVKTSSLTTDGLLRRSHFYGVSQSVSCKNVDRAMVTEGCREMHKQCDGIGNRTGPM